MGKMGSLKCFTRFRYILRMLSCTVCAMPVVFVTVVLVWRACQLLPGGCQEDFTNTHDSRVCHAL